MTPTHQKHPYHAECIQWNGSNLEQVMELLPQPTELTVRHEWLTIRFSPGEVKALHYGEWVVRGENGVVKCYSDEQFNVKYQAI